MDEERTPTAGEQPNRSYELTIKVTVELTADEQPGAEAFAEALADTMAFSGATWLAQRIITWRCLTPRYVVSGGWEHLDRTGRTYLLRWVYDRQHTRLLVVHYFNRREWVPISYGSLRWREIVHHLTVANATALEEAQPEQAGEECYTTDVLPAWARREASP